MRKRKCMIFIGAVVIGLGSIVSGNTKIYAENNSNEKVSEQFLNEKMTILSEYDAENQTDVVLLENGELWQVYPKVEKMMDGVKTAETEWFSNSEQRVWVLKTDGTLLEETVQGETKVDENVKEIIDSNSRIYLKEDGAVYEREKEDSIKCSVITDDASQIFSWGFVKTDGSIGDYYDGCIIPAEQVEYVSDAGFYIKNEGFYTRLSVSAGSCISDRSSFVNVGDYKLKEISSAKDYYTYRLGVTEDQKVYAFEEQWDNDNSYVEATFCGENPKDIDPSNWMTSDIDWIDQNGCFYKKANRQVVSKENPLTLTYLSYRRNSYDTSIYLQAVAENQGYVMLKDGTEILDNVVDMTGNIVQNKKSVLAIRMDGKVYEMTDTLKELGTIGGTEDKTEDKTGERNKQLPWEPDVLRGYEGNEEHDYILLKNGELWQMFPEVEKITDQVQTALYGSYGNWEEDPPINKTKVWFLKNDGTVWSIGESNAVQVDENVKELNSPTTVLKKDGKLYSCELDVNGNEENQTLVSDNVTRTFGWGYQKEDGSIGDFDGCTLEDDKVDYVSKAGYSISGGGFYTDGWNEGISCINSENNINIGDCKLKEVSAVKYSVEGDYDSYKLGIAEDDSVWAIPVDVEDNTAVYCGENAEYMMPAEVYEADIDWVDKEGHVYKKDKQLVPSLENPLIRSYFNTSDSTWAELSVVAENEGYAAIEDNEIIMDHILARVTTSYEPNEKQHAFILKTDGSVWDVTENPVEIGKIEDNTPSFVRGDVTGDNEVDIKDLRTVLRSVCGKEELTENQKLAADVTGDDQVDIQDLRKLLRFVCGKIETLD